VDGLLAYWVLFGFFALGALVSPLTPAVASRGPGPTATEHTPFRLFFVLGTIGMICMVGLRYRIGVDWSTYLEFFDRLRGLSFTAAIKTGDPGYMAVGWFSQQLGAKIWLSNLICAAIFGWGLYRFCGAQPSPWLALAIAVPYLVIVVAMGYTRQAAAVGFLLAGLNRQLRGASIFNFAYYCAAAALFHKTAIVVFPLVAVSARGNRAVNLLIGAALGLFMYNVFVKDSFDSYVHNYIDTAYASQGAFVRVAMNLFAAVLMWGYRGRLQFTPMEWKIWRNFSFAAIVSVVALILSPSSTAVDRVSLYLIPLQIAVLTRVAILGGSPVVGTSLMLGYVMSIEFIWLNYAQFAQFWLPYQLFPF
jgi:EpsG-like putative glucosyltransferase